MSLPELLALLQKSPELLAQLFALVIALSFAVGAFGTGLESLGEAHGWQWLEKLGQRIEAVGSEVPKLLRGSRYTNEVNERVDSILKGAGRE